MEKISFFERMKAYSVPAKDPVDFLEQYTKAGFGVERGKQYQQARIESAYDELKQCGFCMLSSHESKTGETVTWYPKA